MAVSGSKDFTVTETEIIKGAIRLLGRSERAKIGPDPENIQAREALNMMTKAWQAEGIGIWMFTEAALFLGASAESYSIGPTGDHATASYVKTELASAGSTGDTNLTVDSISGITASDYLGIELDDNTIQWTTVSGSPASSTVVAATALTGDAAVDNHIYTYTTKLTRPLEIIEARLHQDDDNEITINLISRSEYMLLADKDTTGLVTQLYYDTQLTNGKLFVWPTAINMKEYIKFTVRLAVDDFDAAANNAQFPIEWLRALKFNLAAEIALEYDVGAEKFTQLTIQARMTKKQAQRTDKELTSIFFEAA